MSNLCIFGKHMRRRTASLGSVWSKWNRMTCNKVSCWLVSQNGEDIYHIIVVWAFLRIFTCFPQWLRWFILVFTYLRWGTSHSHFVSMPCSHNSIESGDSLLTGIAEAPSAIHRPIQQVHITVHAWMCKETPMFGNNNMETLSYSYTDQCRNLVLITS